MHSEEFWQGVCSDLQDGEIAVTEETLHRTEAVADVLKYACKQLAATVTSDDAFRIIWVSFDGHDQDLRWNQVLATFYGIKYVSPRGLRSPKSNADYCYYFDYSVAHSHSNIDALAICDGDNFQFCLNEFSPRYALLKATRFHALLQELGAILDPTALVRDGIAIALRSTISRSDKAIVEAALSEQEGADYISFDLNRHAVHASVYHKE